MKHILHGLFIVFLNVAAALAQAVTPQQSLNNYVEFLNRSTGVLTNRFQMVKSYQEEVDQYRKRPFSSLRLPSSGPLEEFYYQKALNATGLSAAEKQKLNKGAKAVWDVLNELDETGKSLETYLRLETYKTDNLKESEKLIAKMHSVFWRYRTEKAAFYKEINEVALKHQPYLASDPYLATEKEMRDILKRQQQLLDSLPFFLNQNTKTAWPVAMIQRSMLADEKSLAEFGKLQAKIAYPASAVVPDFKEALYAIQKIKRSAIDDHNFAAQQSAEHGNHVYLSLINQYNNDLLAAHQSFINYSQLARKMVYFPSFSPVMVQEMAGETLVSSSQTPAFQDKPLITFETKYNATPASPATVETLNGYVELINESLRQMHLLQILVRNYQSSAEMYRDPARARRGNLTYRYEDFKVPVSAYQLLINASSNIPQPYRTSVNTQAEVLLNMLKEMDGLSIELVGYAAAKTYLSDQLKRSDAILDRYLVLFDLFDEKKEQLYNDVRRIHESFPNTNPASSWTVSGNALLQTMDDDHAVLWGVKDFFKGKKTDLPPTEKLQENARKLIADEYKNMKGLQRYGRANGNCPYSPYEDLPANSIRLAEMVQKVQPPTSASRQHPFESFYYFYNNELVYQYNKFIELSKTGLLKTINQPDLFVFQRITANTPGNQPPVSLPAKKEKPVDPQPVNTIAGNETTPISQPSKPVAAATERPAEAKRDTVYIERVKVDTVYIDRGNNGRETVRSLEGFAANNMVLLLDVSSSMNSPLKMPLLKRSIKSLLTLLRTEDQISIVLYSGKARVVLKPTSGAKSAEIARMIDLLKSDGDTDGNEGIKLAYKTANKQYIRGGNNRIVLATDGEFPVSEEVMQMIGQNARQDLYLTVFTFGRNEHTGQKLRKLSELGQGTYAHVTEENADLQLILEAQARKRALK